MGAPKKADWREERRKRAWELKQAGWKQKDIAVALGVTEGAVSQWIKRGREGGEEALEAHPAKGATPRLTLVQQEQIPNILARGAPAYGFRGAVWNSRRLAVAIKRECGVSYHPDHCGYLVRKMGYSMQKPTRRATQRNEEAIEHWKRQRWPQLKKKPSRKSARSFLEMKRAFICCQWLSVPMLCEGTLPYCASS
jgi:transposase